MDELPGEVHSSRENNTITPAEARQQDQRQYDEMRVEESHKRASKLEVKNASLLEERNELMEANAQQTQDLEARGKDIKALQAEIKKQEKIIENLERDMRVAGEQHERDKQENETMSRNYKSCRERLRDIQEESHMQETMFCELQEHFKETNDLNDQYQQRLESLQEVAVEHESQKLKIYSLEQQLSRAMDHIHASPHDMEQENTDSDMGSSRPSSGFGETRPPLRTMDIEMQDAEPSQSNHDPAHPAHPLNQGFDNEMDWDFDDAFTDLSSNHNFLATVDSDSLMDSSVHPNMEDDRDMSSLNEDTASSSDETDTSRSDERISESNTTCSEDGNDTDDMEEIRYIQTDHSISPAPDRASGNPTSNSETSQMPFDVRDDWEDSTANSRAQDMAWQSAGWKGVCVPTDVVSSPSAVQRRLNRDHPHRKRSRGDIVDDKAFLSENKKQRSDFVEEHTQTRNPVSDQITQIDWITTIASPGCRTDEPPTAALDDIQAAQKPEHADAAIGTPSSQSTSTSTGAQTKPRPETSEEGTQTENYSMGIAEQEIQAATPRKRSLETIPRPQTIPIYLRIPLLATDICAKQRFKEHFKLFTNADQDQALPSYQHQQQVQATLPSLQDDTSQGYLQAESMATHPTENAYLDNIWQWVIGWILFALWMVYMWWTDEQWQWAKANEAPRDILHEVRRGRGNENRWQQLIGYEVVKFLSVDRVALG